MIKNIIITLFCLSFTSVAQAVLKIDITEGFEGALPIAVIPFQWHGGQKTINGDVSAIVVSDLARSGKFSPVAEKNLIARPKKLEDVHYKTFGRRALENLSLAAVVAIVIMWVVD